jgi:DNA-binding NtrC family response regulator
MSVTRRIVIADSDPGSRETVGQFFSAKGFKVLPAQNGLEALLHVKHERPEVVILDIQMSRLGGLEALKRIRAFDRGIKVVIVSGSLDAETRQQALASGAVGVFQKPVALDDLQSLLGAGTPPTAATTAAAAPPPASAPEAAAETCRILVVDDDREIRSLQSEFLSGQGHTVQTASGGAEALRELGRTEPDVILLDIEMPGLSGVDALPSLRALAPNAAVIMVSGTADVELSKLALSRGAFDFVTKPVDFRYLTQSLETAVAMKAVVG